MIQNTWKKLKYENGHHPCTYFLKFKYYIFYFILCNFYYTAYMSPSIYKTYASDYVHIVYLIIVCLNVDLLAT